VRLRRRIEWIDTDAAGIYHWTTAFRLAEAAEAALYTALGIEQITFGAGGRLQLADEIIHHEVSEDARKRSTSGPAESPARCSRVSTRACWSSGRTPTSPKATS
jgi:hypothetical protein